MASDTPIARKSALRILNKTNSAASVKLVPVGDIQKVKKQLKRAEKEYDRGAFRVGLNVGVGPVDAGLEVEPQKEISHEQDEEKDIEIEFGYF
ncbi:unnamed protein product [Vitrella brassicaformis CCMP3155]|uniref:Uncharacterized protein n=1 Tax=Vitrella brassicaformis (strain CCMP3155) TaxID=1169540 RepID=A0A0G4EKG8_VITBC|nr:unnamed protein product [Vitrella brassicaformis CCMP3155]|eukprot:CEL96918.1 unnamed protein product [Vitrella brassicaformis CCMP3155]